MLAEAWLPADVSRDDMLYYVSCSDASAADLPGMGEVNISYRASCTVQGEIGVGPGNVRLVCGSRTSSTPTPAPTPALTPTPMLP